MISVSDAWKDIQRRFLLTESFIEIDCGITDEEAQSVATASGTDEAVFSNAKSVVGVAEMAKYATAELNLWSLDGTRNILYSTPTLGNAGYGSNIESTGSVTVSFPAIRTTAISGITITWSEKYGEYPKIFSVIGKNGSTVISEVTVTDNRENVSLVNMPLVNYDNITVVVHAWNLPHRRARIEKIVIGHVLTFGKKDLLGFSHEQSGDLLSGQLPKYSIEFTLDNTDGRWDPNNPSGMSQYLSERQRITVKYGLDVNGITEWIKAGTFYLSEWSVPSNGLEARFVARDAFEFLLNADMNGGNTYGNLYHIARWASLYLLPKGATIVVDSSLNQTPSRELDIKESTMAAEIVQKCANAACCIIRYDRDGVLYVEPLKKVFSEYIHPEIGIPLSLSYSYPEISLTKPLKKVVVNYGEDTPYEYDVTTSGETQTVANDYILNTEYAAKVASWVTEVLKSRKTISGEFRADPRLDLYDIVTVEDRYGKSLTVVITDIKYTFNGSFHGSYTGRVLEEV